MTDNDSRKKKELFSKDYVWAFSTYFTEGFPFAIIRSVSSFFFRDMNVSLESIGMTSLYGLPWTLKFLWGPWVDEYGTKRQWLLGMQSILFIIFILTAVLAPLESGIQAIAILFFIGAIIAATHDIAIDGYYMEALDRDGQAKFVGYRTMAYRIAWMGGTGVIATIGAAAGWFLGFLSAAVLFGLFLHFHVFFLKEVQPAPKKKIKDLFTGGISLKRLLIFMDLALVIVGIRYFFQSPFYNNLREQAPLLKKIGFAHWAALLLLLALVLVGVFRNRIKAIILKDPDSQYARAFVSFMDRDKIGIMLAFIILLRTGEWTLANMVSPFIVDVGIKIHYGWISGAVGLPSAVVGALLGGWMIARYTLKKVMWPFILAQNLTNVVYMALALHLSQFITLNTGVEDPTSIGGVNLVLVALTNGFDQFAGGLGNAVLMTYLMRICLKEFKAAHYAIGSGLMSFTGIFAGVFSGIIAGWLGYAWLFGLSFIASIPAMVLIPFLPYLDDKEDKKLGS